MMRNLFLIILSSALLILSFPGFNLWFLAWIAFVPLFFAIENKKPPKAFAISYAAGLIFFAGTIYWLVHVTLPGTIGVILYLALYFGFFGLFCNYVLRPTAKTKRSTPYHSLRSGTGRAPAVLLTVVPAAWVTLEIIRSHLITGFGWNLIGYSQSYALPIIQMADFTGPYGVSFLVVMVNTAVFLTIKEVREKDRRFVSLAIALLAVFIALYYGVFRMKNIFTGDKLNIAVVQGNIPQVRKWDVSFREPILNKYGFLTKDAVSTSPELIIWPETSVPGFLESEKDLFLKVAGLARDVKTPILVGAPREDASNPDAYYNSAILLDEKGAVAGRYDKIHLVPFGEYVPWRKVFSFVENFAPSPIGDFSAGKEYTVFNFFVRRSGADTSRAWHLTKKVKFSVLICFEDIFPDLTRIFVKNGANFLVNITNDAWFGRTSAAEQHAQNSIFRAVENRVNVVRAANTGISCFIDQKGMVVAKVDSGKDAIFIDGFKTHEITLTRTRTFYTVYGDVFAYACVFITALYLLLKRRKR